MSLTNRYNTYHHSADKEHDERRRHHGATVRAPFDPLAPLQDALALVAVHVRLATDWLERRGVGTGQVRFKINRLLLLLVVGVVGVETAVGLVLGDGGILSVESPRLVRI